MRSCLCVCLFARLLVYLFFVCLFAEARVHIFNVLHIGCKHSFHLANGAGGKNDALWPGVCLSARLLVSSLFVCLFAEVRFTLNAG